MNNQTTYTRLLTEETSLISRTQSILIVLNASLCFFLGRFNGSLLSWLIILSYVFSILCSLITIKSIDHGDLLHDESNDPGHEARLERQARIVKFRQKTCTLSLYGLFVVFGLLLLEVIL